MDDTATAPLDHLVAELLDVHGCLEQIVDHMERNAHHAPPGNPPRAVILTNLLRETLCTVEERHGAAAVAGAAELLGTCAQAITDDIFLVPLGPAPPNRAARRAAGNSLPERRRRR